MIVPPTPLPDLVGVSDICRLLGITKPGLAWHRRADANRPFPAPAMTVASRPLWLRSDVLEWQTTNPAPRRREATG